MSIRWATRLPVKLYSIVFCVSLLLSLFETYTVRAQADAIRVSAKIGFDGFCVEDTWLPIRVEVENTGQDLNGVIEVSYKTGSGEQSITRTEIDLPAGSRKEVFLYTFYTEYYTPKLVISLLDGKKVLKQVSYPMNCLAGDAKIYGVLADNPSVYDVLNDVKSTHGTVRVAQLSIPDLPDRAESWDALDALVISNVDTSVFTSEQRRSLSSWIAAGGKLLIVGGINWQATAAGLQDVLPLEINSTRRVSSLSKLEAYVQVEQPLDSEMTLVSGTLQDDAVVLVQQEGVPVLIEKPLGFGAIYLLAADPALQPLRNWAGMKVVYEYILGSYGGSVPWQAGVFSSYEANQALAAIPELELPSAVYIWCLLGLYVVIIGPVNYFALRRWKRRELGWLTIPALVILFSTLAYSTGYFYRGATPTLNRLAVAQAWENRDTARVTALIGIYSPVRTKYDLEARDHSFIHPFSDGVMDLQSDDQWINVQQGEHMILPDVRGDIAAMKSVVFQGSMPALEFSHDLVLTLGNGIPTLAGTVTNQSPHNLRDAILVAAGHWKHLGDLGPGESASARISMFPFSSTSNSNFYRTDSMTLLQLDYADVERDQDAARRQAFLTVLLYSNYQSVYGDSGIYLMGWVDGIEQPVTLAGQNPKTIDTLFYVDKLSPSVLQEPGELQLPVTMMNWESSMSNVSPYYVSEVQSGGYILRFQPAIPIKFQAIKSLTLHIQSNVQDDDLLVSLWDHELQDWTHIPILGSRTDVSDAQRFVGPNGDVRMQVRTKSSGWTEMSASYITLVVQP